MSGPRIESCSIPYFNDPISEKDFSRQTKTFCLRDKTQTISVEVEANF